MENENVAPETNSQGTETTTEATTESQTPTTYLQGKYDSVSALEKGYTELQSSYSKKTQEYQEAMSGLTGAPEAYEMNEGVSISDSMQDYARENNFSNEALNNLAEAYQSDKAAASEAFYSEQRELLGKDADTRLTNVQDWAKANLGADSMEAFEGMINSAASVEMFEQIMKMNSGTAPAKVAQPKTMVDHDTITTMRFAKDNFGRRKMSSDPTYRAKVEAMEKEFVGGGGKL